MSFLRFEPWYRELLKTPRYLIRDKTMSQNVPRSISYIFVFFELLRLRDQSQIVDLIFAVRAVASRASETSKVPHSWQNNVPKRSTNYFVYCHYFLSYWGSGPVSDCRSHFCGSSLVIESFWNFQGTSFVTKHCPKCSANKYAKFRHQIKWWVYLWIHWAEERICLHYRKVVYGCY